MIPTYFIELADTPILKDVRKKYFEDQYPDTSDCAVLDNQIISIQSDIDAIKARISKKQKECNCPPTVKVPCVNSGFTALCIGGYKSAPNPDYTSGIVLRESSKKQLTEMLLKKKQLQSVSCQISTTSTSGAITSTSGATTSTSGTTTSTSGTTTSTSGTTTSTSGTTTANKILDQASQITNSKNKYYYLAGLTLLILTGGFYIYKKSKQK